MKKTKRRFAYIANLKFYKDTPQLNWWAYIDERTRIILSKNKAGSWSARLDSMRSGTRACGSGSNRHAAVTSCLLRAKAETALTYEDCQVLLATVRPEKRKKEGGTDASTNVGR